MPEMNDKETYDRLNEINLEIKVLVASGYVISHQAGEIMKRGGTGFINNPFKINDLSQKIRELLD